MEIWFYIKYILNIVNFDNIFNSDSHSHRTCVGQCSDYSRVNSNTNSEFLSTFTNIISDCLERKIYDSLSEYGCVSDDQKTRREACMDDALVRKNALKSNVEYQNAPISCTWSKKQFWFSRNFEA